MTANEAASQELTVTAGGDKPFLELVPGTAGQPHVTIENAHHFFQEDDGPQLAQVIIDAVAKG